MKRLRLFILFWILLPVYFVEGQTIFPEAKIYTVNEGLSQSRINTIIQDSRGFIWVGTEDGLNRYDGYNFNRYTHLPNDTNSLSSNYINAICEDKDGILWIATNRGLNSFDVRSGKFTSFQYTPGKSGSISDNVVLNVYIDEEKNIWVKTLKSLDLFDAATNVFRSFTHFYDLFKFSSGNIPYPIHEDKVGRLWVGSKDGLNYFDRDLQLFNRFTNFDYNPTSISNNEIRAIYEDKDGSLWIGTSNGLNAFNASRKDFKHYFPNPDLKNKINANKINVLFEDNTGRFWVGTGDGLFLFNKINGVFTKINDQHHISFNTPVYSIIQDQSGLLWFGTHKGLIKANTRKTKFKLYNSSESPLYSFSAHEVNVIEAVDNDIFWIGTKDAGLNLLNRKLNTVKNYDFSRNGVDDDNIIHCIYRVDDQKILLGTDNGVSIFNPESGTLSYLDNTISGSEALVQNRVNYITRDAKGKFWVATYHGLYKLDLENRQVKSFLNNPEDNKSLLNNTIYSLAAEPDGKLWIGTDNGLDCMNIESEKFTHYNTVVSGKQFLSSNTVYCLKFDKSGILWVGTASGLNRVNIKNKSVTVISEKEGLSDDLIYAILIDKKQNVWVSTNRGLNSINAHDLKVRSFDVFDGLQDYEFNHNAACTTKNGELFFGGVAGFNSFYPDSLVRNNYIPPIVITTVEIITSQGERKIQNPSSVKIVIPYRTHVFTINFAALDFTYSEKNNYAYKFYSDTEKDWINIGRKHFATFSNLQPGDYHFKVKGSNNDMVWNQEGLSLTIRVESPFWLKTEAYYMYSFAILITLFALYRYRTYNLRRTNRILKEKELASHKIDRQREQLALKNRNITDSINYAKRIQEALMPSEKTFKKIIPESFVLHQPKDIVSGDFFWISEQGNKVYVAAVDCTGHGVPGAFMSIIGFELFRKITHSQGIDDPSQILNILNREFEEIFKDVDNDKLRDGMDIAFCVIDKSTRVLEFSGAVNPIYLIRDNKITEIRGSRFSVGLEDQVEQEQAFENKQIVLHEDDVIYLFSDGYADQFGGPEGKKFKYRRFRHLLLTIHQYPMDDQQRLLEERINLWKGSLEQVDDILVIGFRPLFNR